MGQLPYPKRVLDLALSEKVREEDTVNFIHSVALTNRAASDVAWEFVMNNTVAINSKLIGEDIEESGYGKLLTKLALLHILSERKEELINAYSALPEEEQVQWVLEEVMDKMDGNEAWENENNEHVCEYILEVLE